MWVSIYLMEAPPLIGDVSISSFPPPMPLAKALQPIALPQGPHYVFLAPFFFFYVIVIFVSILTHPVKVS